MKFLRSLPKRFDTLITVLVRTTLKDLTPQQIFQEVMTDDSYREDDKKDELVKKKKKENEKKDDEKKKSGIQSHHIQFCEDMGYNLKSAKSVRYGFSANSMRIIRYLKIGYLIIFLSKIRVIQHYWQITYRL